MNICSIFIDFYEKKKLINLKKLILDYTEF